MTRTLGPRPARGELAAPGGRPVPGRAAACQACGQPLTRNQQLTGSLCSHWRCRWASLDALLREHRAAAAAALGVNDADRYPPVVVPWRESPVVALPPERVAKFREHLERITGEAVGGGKGAPDDRTPPLGPVETALLAQVCAVCRGACCHHGADRAFLEAGFVKAAPTAAGAADIVAAYVAHLPRETYRGSCVYHTPRGCTLPTVMRAPICGAYRCRGLRDQLEHLRRTGAAQGFVVVRHDHRIVRSAFVGGTAIRPFPAE